MKIAIIISGASNAKIALDLAQILSEQKHCEVHLIATKGAKRALALESQIKLKIWKQSHSKIIFHKNSNLGSKLASGSSKIDAYFVYASANFVAKASAGIASNLALRAVAVALKERRKIIIAPREMPLSLLTLKALCELHSAGAIIAPGLGASYAGCSEREFIIARWALLLGKKLKNFKKWKGVDK